MPREVGSFQSSAYQRHKTVATAQAIPNSAFTGDTEGFWCFRAISASGGIYSGIWMRLKLDQPVEKHIKKFQSYLCKQNNQCGHLKSLFKYLVRQSIL